MSTLKVNNLTDLGADAVVTDGVIDSGALPTGSILQVVSTTKTDTFTMSSATYADVTGLSASITPSSTSSKIFVLLNTWGDTNTADIGMLRLMRDATPIGVGDSEGSRVAASVSFSTFAGSNDPTSASASVLDSPNTTSTITYKAQIRLASGTAYINRYHSDINSAVAPRTASSITLMEVAG